MEGDWMPQGPALPTATQVHPADTEAPEEEEDTEAETPVTLAPATEEDWAATGATRVPTAEMRAPAQWNQAGTMPWQARGRNFKILRYFPFKIKAVYWPFLD